jgi:hypothetical protein
VVAGSGDAGATNFESDGATLYPFRVNSWPSSDPLVTSVGGTMLDLDNNGNRLAPDAVWDDGFGAGGGGESAVFGRPLFQDGVASVVGSDRGTPDISMTAAVNGAAWIYGSFLGAGDPGWTLVAALPRPRRSSPAWSRWPTSWPGTGWAGSTRTCTPWARSASTVSRPASSTSRPGTTPLPA